ncbi:MAG: alpha/beta hydrolase family protein [Candidatus Poribacteria bacterium]
MSTSDVWRPPNILGKIALWASRSLLSILGLCLLVPVGHARTSAPVLRNVEFHSPAVARAMKYSILLPSEYEHSQERYPTVYLLHGVGGNYTGWTADNNARFYAGLFKNLIIVMPDAGNSFYVNWAESNDGRTDDWEDYIVEDVVGHVDAHFRTIAAREGRAISGLSMGGYGAITLGLRHPDMFGSVGSTSGYLIRARTEADRLRRNPKPRTRRRRRRSGAGSPTPDETRMRPDPAIGIEGFSSQDERTPKGIMFASAEQADAHDPFKLIHEIPVDKLPHIYLDCGTEDPLIGFTREFARVLLDKGVTFDFMQMPGGHNSVYWTRALGHVLGVQYEVLQRALGRRP